MINKVFDFRSEQTWKYIRDTDLVEKHPISTLIIELHFASKVLVLLIVWS